VGEGVAVDADVDDAPGADELERVALAPRAVVGDRVVVGITPLFIA